LTQSTAAVQETPASAHSIALTDKIQAKTARVGIVGLGYVGLPLAVEYANAGYSVAGIDLQSTKVDAINRGESYVQDVRTDDMKSLVAAGKLTPTTDFSVISTLDTVNICVPTPLRKTKDPDRATSCRRRRRLRILSRGHAGDSSRTRSA
jgi:UDP-N-acetyl-D-mannosaminuronate dehydrogenase